MAKKTGLYKMTAADLERAAVICQDYTQNEMGLTEFDRPYFASFVRGTEKVPEFMVRGVYEEGTLIGCSAATVAPRYDRPGKTAMILWNVLSRGRRRRGWGRRIVELFMDWAKSHGAEEVWTTVPVGATDALKAYEAMGFKVAEIALKKVVS